MSRLLALVIAFFIIGGLSCNACAARRRMRTAPTKPLPDLDASGLLGLRTPVVPGQLAGRVVVLDPGHGGSASGARGSSGMTESSLNLAVARELRESLIAGGATVVMTRVGDSDCLIQPKFVLRDDLVARARISNQLQADLFLSCHHNDLPRRTGRLRQNRTEVYYRMDDEGPSRAFGARVFDGLFPLLKSSQSVLVPGAFAVLRYNERPAVLGEPFYMRSALERYSHDPRWAPTESGRYLAGIVDYLKKSCPAPRIARPVEGEIVERETFPMVVRFDSLPAEASVVVTVSGRGVDVKVDRQARKAWVSVGSLANGPVVVDASVAGPSGVFSPVTRRRFVFSLPPARIQARVWPDAFCASYPGPWLVRATVEDHRGLPVADGTPVIVSLGKAAVATGVTESGEADLMIQLPPTAPTSMTNPLLPTASTTKTSPLLPTAPTSMTNPLLPTASTSTTSFPSGPHSRRSTGVTMDSKSEQPTSLSSHLAPSPLFSRGAEFVISSGSITTSLGLRSMAFTPFLFARGRLVDATTHQSVLRAEAVAPQTTGVLAMVNRQTGEYLVSGSVPRVWVGFSAEGFLPLSSQALALSTTGVIVDLALEPILGGAFRGSSVVFDADPGSGFPSLLAEFHGILKGTGIKGTYASWSGVGELSEQERAKIANRTPAELGITMLSGVGASLGGPVEVQYYHASERGKAIAAALADSFRRYSPSLRATTLPGTTFFLNNTKTTTIGLRFAGRRSPRLTHDQVAYVVFHGLARALRPDLPRGRTVSGQVRPGIAPRAWVYLDNGDRCRVAPSGRFTFLDVQPGRHTIWVETPTEKGPGRGLTMTLDVP